MSSGLLIWVGVIILFLLPETETAQNIRWPNLWPNHHVCTCGSTGPYCLGMLKVSNGTPISTYKVGSQYEVYLNALDLFYIALLIKHMDACHVEMWLGTVYLFIGSNV